MLKIEEVEISPTLAKMMMEKNTENFRDVNASRVARYASDMSNGSWLYCADPIRFAEDGTLLDGQHRLHAIIKAGVIVKCLVIHGLPKGSSMMMDKGQSRSAKSWLSHEGVKSATHIASIARMCIMHRKQKWHYVSFGSESPSDADVIAFASEFSETLQSSLRLARTCGKKTYLSTSLLAALMHEAAFPRMAENVEDCVWFCSRLHDGLNIIASGLRFTQESPVYHLRERFYVAGDKKNAAKRESDYLMRVLATIAWNKTALRESVKVLRFITEGKSPSVAPKEILKAM